MWLILLVTLVTLCYAYAKWKHSYWSRRGVPNPGPSLPFGNIGQSIIFKKHLGELITEWYRWVGAILQQTTNTRKLYENFA